MTMKIFVGLLIWLVLGISAPSFGLFIAFNDITPGGNMPAPVLAGFTEAAALWQSLLFDPVTVRIDISYEPFGPGPIGSTDINEKPFAYEEFVVDTQTLGDAIVPALIADQYSADDVTAVANLQKGLALDFRTTNHFGAIERDGNPNPLIPDASNIARVDFIEDGTGDDRLDNGGINNLFLNTSTANAKALGLMFDANNNPVDDGVTSDAEIKINSDRSWDFSRLDGLNPTNYDFVGTVAHEIGHTLGFNSGVDFIDANPTAPIDDFANFTILDLYRYSTDSLALTPAPGDSGVLDLAVGGTPFFSIDGGTTNLGLFSTGRYNGDGNQAGHWKDDDFLGGVSLGLMDPKVGVGELQQISALDLLAFDVIGWNTTTKSIPAPSSLLLLGIGVLGVLGCSWRRRKNLSK
jgi:hypothetical protein